MLQSWMRKCQAQLRYKNEVSRAIFQGMEYMDEAALFNKLGEVSVVLDDMARTDGFLEDGMIATSTSTPVKNAPPVVARADVVFDMEFVKRLISDVRQKVVVEASLVLAILKAVSKVFMPRPNICKAEASISTKVTVIGMISRCYFSIGSLIINCMYPICILAGDLHGNLVDLLLILEKVRLRYQ